MESLCEQNVKSVELIKTWINSQPHLPQIEEKSILLFLHSNYYSLPETKSTIENYFTFRTNCKDFFTNQDIQSDEMKNVMSYIDFSPLPHPTPEGYKIAFMKFSDTDASRFSLVQLCKFLTMCMNLWLQEEGLAEGHIMIYDMTGLNLGHLARLGVFPTKYYLYYIQEALPIRMKGFYFTNIIPFMDKIMFLIKPFLKKELLDVLKLHSGKDSLFNCIPQKCLPFEYGGDAGTIEDLKNKFYEKLHANREQFLIEEVHQKVDERKRSRDESNLSYLSKAFRFVSMK